MGNGPVLVQMPMANGVFVGAVMDLYVTGIALSAKQVFDLSKGESSIYLRVNRILRLRSQILNRGPLDVKKSNILFRLLKIALAQCFGIIRLLEQSWIFM